MLCNICFNDYRHLGSHVAQKHEMKARDYKIKYGMDLGTPLTEPEVQEKQRRAILNHPKQLANFVNSSANSRIKKGQRIRSYFSKDFKNRVSEWGKANQKYDKEIVICAAVKTKEKKGYRGHRHGDCFKAILDRGLKPSKTASGQGFITSRNRYVTREVGRKLQDAAGIKSADPEGYRGTTLFSEDLY